MKFILLLLTIILSTAQANLGSFDSNGKLIYPETNKPYTGNLDIINNDWGVDAVEFNKDYVDGVLHGAEKVFYRSGKLKSVGYFNKGLIDGTTTLYYEDGALQAQVSFNNGMHEGRAVSYYPDGTKQSEQFYVTDKLYGLSRQWFDTGSLMISRDYSKGLLHGEVTTYYESGKVFEVTKFNYGTPKFKRTYNEDGSLAKEEGFFDRETINNIIS